MDINEFEEHFVDIHGFRSLSVTKSTAATQQTRKRKRSDSVMFTRVEVPTRITIHNISSTSESNHVQQEHWTASECSTEVPAAEKISDQFADLFDFDDYEN